jgi:glyoxylase I family protein
MNGEVDVAKHLQSLEEQLLSPEGRASPRLIGDLLADDFQEIGSSGGMFGKAEVLKGLAEESGDGHVYARHPSDWSVRMLSADVALVTYRVIRRDLAEDSAAASLRSSIWVLRGGRWQMVFHQGTRLEASA